MKARQLVFRGRVLAEGLLLERHARERALALWQPGVQCFEGPAGLTLVFPTPRPVRVDQAQGAPLVRLGGRLCSAPLEPDERQGPEDSLYLVRGGRVQVHPRGTTVDPASWLELDLERHPVDSLGLPPPPPVIVSQGAHDGRAVFSDTVVPDSEQISALLEAFKQAAHAPPPEPKAEGWWTRNSQSWIKDLRGMLGKAGTADGGPGGSDEPPPPAEPGWMDKLDSWLAERLVQTGMGSVVGQAHARYLDDLMKQFEQGGDLMEALRRAIPLGGEGGLGRTLAGMRAPSPRGDLRFTAGGRGKRTVVPIAEQLMAQLKEHYKNARRRLEAAGQIEEAAFVLAELLNEPMEAVALLEKHELWQKAAELAEVKKLHGALPVRLWFLAGDVERAVRCARRLGGMPDAIQRLHERDPRAADQLRVAWAATLAAQGQYGAAVTSLQDCTTALSITPRWIEHAIDQGGPLGARALAGALQSGPEGWQRRYAQAQLWLQADLLSDTLQLAAALHPLPTDAPVLQPLRRQLLRQLLSHRAEQGAHAELDAALGQLRALLGGGLQVDLAHDPVSVPRALSRRRAPQERVVADADRGSQGIHDACWLPSGRLLLAMGEAGVLLVNRRGEVLRRWEQSAHSLAVHEQGGLAIGLAARGKLWRLSRFDLATGEGSHWCEAAITGFADRFTDPWMVLRGHDVLAIDPIAQTWRSTWKVDFQQPVSQLAVTGEHLSFSADGERWHYRLPSLGLRERAPLELERTLGVGAGGEASAWCLNPQGALHMMTHSDEGWRLISAQIGLGEVLGDAMPRQFMASERWLGVALGDSVMLVHAGAPRLKVSLRGGQPRFRLDDGHLVVWDEHGRVLVFELEHGRLRMELRR